jgi:hypothetical protein
MNEVAKGPGWWQASDGKWYSPDVLPEPPDATAGQFSGYATSPPWQQSTATAGGPPPPFPGGAIAQYCVTCGNGLVTTAAICPRCGTPVSGARPGQVGAKPRTVAVLLAVFLSFWSFLYTYRISPWKFLLGLGLNVSALILDVIVTAAHGPGNGIAVVWFLIMLGVWIWSIVDRSITSL